MTTVTDEAAHQHDDVEPAGGRRILTAHFSGFDLEILGLTYHNEGGGIDRERGPSDAKGLTALLHAATTALRRIGRSRRSELAAAGHALGEMEEHAEERLHRWLMRKVRHIVRYVLGRLAKLAAGQLWKRSEEKKAARRPRHGGGEPRSRSPRPTGQKGKSQPGSAKNGRATAQRNGTRTARTARKTVRELPEDQVQRLARGLAPQEAGSVAKQLHARPEDAAPLLHEMERAARERIGSSG